MPMYRYTLTEYQPDKPWLIKATSTGLTVELDTPANFDGWAAERYPSELQKATLDPGQLAPLLKWG